MSEEQGLFQPENMEIDTSSKLSLLEHISFRLRMPDRIEHSSNGHLSGEQFLKLTKEVVANRAGADPTDDKAISTQLKSIYQEMLDRKDLRLSFINEKEINKMSKSELGSVIAGSQGFSFEGDHHIGERNGVVSRQFMEELLDSLDVPGEPNVSLNRDSFPRVKRPDIAIRTASEINALIGIDDRNDWSEVDRDEVMIVVPDYQRSNQNWNKPKKVALIDSMLRDIPMPTIVLGRTGKDMPHQLVDGQQRLINLHLFLQDKEFYFHGKMFSELETWMQDRIRNYRWNVEHITAKSDRDLALLYERYNSSGKTMTPVQIRLARFHEVSALHHYLLAMAGGPKLDHRDTTRMRLGIGSGPEDEEQDQIERLARRAKDIRNELPRVGVPTTDERRQVRQVTEKTYDILCRIIGYSMYRSIVDRPSNDYPTAKAALDVVLPHFRHGSKATDVADRLDLIIRKTSAMFGEYAFTNLKLPRDLEPGQELRYQPIGTVHGWVSQVQCASIWNRSQEEMNILEANPDALKEAWHDFVTRPPNEDGTMGGIVHMRQNSMTIWDMQERWTKEVDTLLDRVGGKARVKEEEERKQRLLGMVDALSNMPEENRNEMIDSMRGSYDNEEIEFILSNL